MNDTAPGRCLLDQGTNTAGATPARGRHPLFGDRRVGGDRLAIPTLHEVIRRQRDLTQLDQRLHAFGRIEMPREHPSLAHRVVDGPERSIEVLLQGRRDRWEGCEPGQGKVITPAEDRQSNPMSDPGENE